MYVCVYAKCHYKASPMLLDKSYFIGKFLGGRGTALPSLQYGHHNIVTPCIALAASVMKYLICCLSTCYITMSSRIGPPTLHLVSVPPSLLTDYHPVHVSSVSACNLRVDS